MRIRVLVVDDEARVRTGLRLVLESEPDIEVVGEAPETKVIVVTTFNDDSCVHEALRVVCMGMLTAPHGREILPRMGFHITGEAKSDLVLDEYPFALLTGMLLDQQYPMEHAFRGPAKVLDRFGTLDPQAIATADPEEFAALCAQPPAVHRFPGSMAGRIQAVARHVVEEYGGDTARLWTEATDARELMRRLTALPGFGTQKAQIFTALLAKRLGVRLDGWEAAAGGYAEEGYRSVADVVDADSLQRVRDYKKAKKAAARS